MTQQETDPASAEAAPRSGVRWIMLLPLLLFAFLGGVLGYQLFSGRDGTIPSALIDRPVPVFDLPALQAALTGDRAAEPRFTSDMLSTGEVTVVNFWASWCAPCRVEHPELVALSEMGVRVVGVAYKDTPPASKRFLDELGDPFETVGADVDGRVALTWGLAGVPETFVVDGDGVIRHRHVGPILRHELQDQILPAIEAAR